MASPSDIQRFILKETKKLDGVDDKEAKNAADVCSKFISEYYKKNKDNGDANSKAIAKTKVDTYKGKDGKKHVKITSGELKCISKPVRSKLDKMPDDIKGVVGKIWAEIEKQMGKKWEDDAKKGNPQLVYASRSCERRNMINRFFYFLSLDYAFSRGVYRHSAATCNGDLCRRMFVNFFTTSSSCNC